MGRRLALLALHNDYRSSRGSYSSAFYKSHEILGKKILVSFKHARELKTRGDQIIGFQVAGMDKVFVEAQARIVEHNQVEVWNDQLLKPVAVRYGWRNAAETNLSNEIGLPVATFKTDDWPYTTEGNKFLAYPKE